jgi:hypothetical protein
VYKLEVPGQGSDVQVCRSAFLAITGYSPDVVRSAKLEILGGQEHTQQECKADDSDASDAKVRSSNKPSQ